MILEKINSHSNIYFTRIPFRIIKSFYIQKSDAFFDLCRYTFRCDWKKLCGGTPMLRTKQLLERANSHSNIYFTKIPISIINFFYIHKFRCFLHNVTEYLINNIVSDVFEILLLFRMVLYFEWCYLVTFFNLMRYPLKCSTIMVSSEI